MRRPLVVLLGVALLGGSSALAGEAKELRAIGEGRGVYLTHCASCHGARGLGTTSDQNKLGVDAPDLTLIENRDGEFRALHVALHIENRDHKDPMPNWPRCFSREYRVPPELQVWNLVKYLDFIQRADGKSELADSPPPKSKS